MHLDLTSPLVDYLFETFQLMNTSFRSQTIRQWVNESNQKQSCCSNNTRRTSSSNRHKARGWGRCGSATL